MIQDKINIRKQTNAFAMQYGMIFGIIWLISFLLLVSGNKDWGGLALVALISIPLYGFIFANLFKKQVQRDYPVTFGRGLLFCILLYVYATAILAIGTYIYFAYFDKGQFVAQNIELLQDPKFKEIFEAPEIQQQLQGYTLSDFEKILKSLTPITITSSIINFNTLLAVIFSIPTALFAVSRKKSI